MKQLKKGLRGLAHDRRCGGHGLHAALVATVAARPVLAEIGKRHGASVKVVEVPPGPPVQAPLAKLLADTVALTREIGAKAKADPNEIGAASVPYLRITGHLCFAWLWARMAALAIGKPVFETKTFYISANAGPSQYAGEQCNPFFFNVAWQNDNLHEAVGKVVQVEVPVAARW